MENYCKINGNSFDATVAISSIVETFDVLDGEEAGRFISGDMDRDIIGTFLGHKITFFNNNNAAFDALWDYLVAHSVDDYVALEAADDQTSVSYNAYYTHGERKLASAADGVNVWDELEINFIAISPHVTP